MVELASHSGGVVVLSLAIWRLSLKVGRGLGDWDAGRVFGTWDAWAGTRGRGKWGREDVGT